MRPSSPQARATLKSAFRAALRIAGGGESFQHATRVSAAVLSRYASPTEDLFPPIDVVLDLEADLGSPVVTSALARLAGWRLTPDESSPSGAPHGDGGPAAARPFSSGAPLDCAVSMVRQAGDLLAAAHAAAADGRYSAAERRELAASLHALGAEVLKMHRAIEDAA